MITINVFHLHTVSVRVYFHKLPIWSICTEDGGLLPFGLFPFFLLTGSAPECCKEGERGATQVARFPRIARFKDQYEDTTYKHH